MLEYVTPIVGSVGHTTETIRYLMYAWQCSLHVYFSLFTRDENYKFEKKNTNILNLKILQKASKEKAPNTCPRETG